MINNTVAAAKFFAEAFLEKNILCIPDYDTPDVTVMYCSDACKLSLPTTLKFNNYTSGINVFIYGILPPGVPKEKRQVINLVGITLQRLYEEAFKNTHGDLRKQLQFRYQELPNELVLQAELTLKIDPYITKATCISILEEYSKIREEAYSNTLKVMKQMGVL